jgi:hypothetical protein
VRQIAERASERKPDPEADWPAVLDGAHTLLAIAGLTLAPIDTYCPTCGCAPCVNVHFCRGCREADQRRENNPQPTKQIWQAAGRCIRRKTPRDSLRTFLKWCDFHGVNRDAALPIFKAIVEKELAK